MGWVDTPEIYSLTTLEAVSLKLGTDTPKSPKEESFLASSQFLVGPSQSLLFLGCTCITPISACLHMPFFPMCLLCASISKSPFSFKDMGNWI